MLTESDREELETEETKILNTMTGHVRTARFEAQRALDSRDAERLLPNETTEDLRDAIEELSQVSRDIEDEVACRYFSTATGLSGDPETDAETILAAFDVDHVLANGNDEDEEETEYLIPLNEHE